MEHPDSSVYNAKLYYAKMLSEADNSRRAKMLFRKQQQQNLIYRLWKRLPVIQRGRVGESVHSST